MDGVWGVNKGGWKRERFWSRLLAGSSFLFSRVFGCGEGVVLGGSFFWFVRCFLDRDSGFSLVRVVMVFIIVVFWSIRRWGVLCFFVYYSVSLALRYFFLVLV